MANTWTTPKDKLWKVWSDLGQEEGHMIGFTSDEDFKQYEHEYNVKTYGENYEELFEQYEAEAEEYAYELWKKQADKNEPSTSSEIFYTVESFVEAIEAQEKDDAKKSAEKVPQAEIECHDVDLDSSAEMQAEEDFLNNNKVSIILDDGTVLETEFSQLKNIC